MAAVVALSDYLEIDDKGLSDQAAFGYYMITMLNKGALSYVSKRLAALDTQNEDSRQQGTRHLSTMAKSLSLLGRDDREKLLDNIAEHFGITRWELGELCSKELFGEELFGKK